MPRYDISDFPRRSHIDIAHEAAITAYGKAGTWLDSRTRVKILEEVRSAKDCPLCLEQRRSLSPYAKEGEHVSQTGLDPITVEY